MKDKVLNSRRFGGRCAPWGPAGPPHRARTTVPGLPRWLHPVRCSGERRRSAARRRETAAKRGASRPRHACVAQGSVWTSPAGPAARNPFHSFAAPCWSRRRTRRTARRGGAASCHRRWIAGRGGTEAGRARGREPIAQPGTGLVCGLRTPWRSRLRSSGRRDRSWRAGVRAARDDASPGAGPYRSRGAGALGSATPAPAERRREGPSSAAASARASADTPRTGGVRPFRDRFDRVGRDRRSRGVRSASEAREHARGDSAHASAFARR